MTLRHPALFVLRKEAVFTRKKGLPAGEGPSFPDG